MAASSSSRMRKKERIMAKTDGHCAYCGIPVQNIDQAYVSHLNHPETGAQNINNLVLACKSCLNKKAGLNLEQFRQSEAVTEFYFEKNLKPEKIGKRNRVQVLEKTDGHCAYCGTGLDMFNMTVDHIVPKKNGGTNSLDNLLPACIVCNQAKSASSIEEFRNKLNKFPESFISSNRLYQCAVKMGIMPRAASQAVFFYERRDDEMPQQSEGMRNIGNAADAVSDESLVYPVSLFGKVCEELPGYAETMRYLPPDASMAERFLKWVLFTWRQDWREMKGQYQRGVIEEMRLTARSAKQEMKWEHCSVTTSCPFESYKSEQTNMLNSLLVDALAAILRDSLNNKERQRTDSARPNLTNDAPIEQAPAPQEFAENADAKQTAAPGGDNAEYRKTLRDRAMELVKKGGTLTSIAKTFNDEKLPTVSGTGKWYASSVSNLVRSYAG